MSEKNALHHRECGVHNRRVLFLGAAAAGASLLLPARDGGAAPAPAAPWRIDTHHHIVPPAYFAAKREALIREAPNSPRLREWTPEMSLASMDANGVATSIVSVSSPGIWYGDQTEARALARGCNDYSADMVRKYPGRFGFFAALPLPDTEGSLREIAHALDTLGADGVCMMSSYDSRWLGDPSFAPVFDELNRRKAVVYVHPTNAACCAAQVADVPPASIEFLMDTTRTILSLLVTSTFTRCPDIRFIFSHGGGALPMFADRVANLTAGERWRDRVPGGAMSIFRRLYVDTASASNPITFTAARSLVSDQHILFGTDFPYYLTERTVEQLSNLKLDAKTTRRIGRDNALGLFPRLAPAAR